MIWPPIEKMWNLREGADIFFLLSAQPFLIARCYYTWPSRMASHPFVSWWAMTDEYDGDDSRFHEFELLCKHSLCFNPAC
jgi:hypothetical protein